MNYISSIVNPAPGKFMVAKSPIEDFNNGTILTVNPGERALFVNQGEIVQIFHNGRYELTTNNYPFLNIFRRFLANGQLTYRCSIFFITETQSAEVLWGFPLQVRDPIQNIFTKIFVRGAYTLRVNDGGKLLLTLLGMNVNFMAAQDTKAFFGNRIQQQITNLLARYINSSQREVIELCNDNIGVATEITPLLGSIIEDCGLEIVNFSISAMQVDENDPNRRFLEMAYAKRREMEIMGNQYAVIKETDIRTNASKTPFANYHPQNYSPTTSIGGSAVAPQGQSNTNGGNDLMQRLKELRSLMDEGLITEAEYNETRLRILNNII